MLLAFALITLASDSLVVCPMDARTGIALIGVQISQLPPLFTTPRDDARTHTSGHSFVTSTPCVPIGGQRVQLRRLGFRPRVLSLASMQKHDSAVDTMRVAMFPVGMLDTARVIAAESDAINVARMTSTLSTTEIRAQGISNATQLINALPFAFPRSTRSDVSVSLRGARPEQVVVTLDGLPLNDPASGRADVSDIPLVALSSASVVPGADPVNAGPGASGGVLALNSASDRSLAVRGGAFGLIAVEAATPIDLNDVIVRVGASLSRAQNNFPFANDIGATGTPTRELRANNDVTRGSLLVSAIAPRVQFTVLGTSTTNGMVGAVNVHEYDRDRATNQRLLLRAVMQFGSTQLLVGARGMSLAYRDPERPTFNATSRVGAGDVELTGMVHALTWRAGTGGDVVHAGDLRQQRVRAFGSAAWSYVSSKYLLNAGARIDHIERAGVLPTFSTSAERRSEFFDVGARIGQSVRSPTLYDLYFSSPQRLSVRALNPERVKLDAELLTRLHATVSTTALLLETSIVSRRTHDAIVWFPGNFSWSPANVGDEAFRGFEVRARSTNRWLDVSAWTSWYTSTLESGELRIPTPYIPTLTGGANATLAWRTWRFTLVEHAMSRRPYTIGPRDAAYELPSVQLIDVAVSRGGRIASARMLWSIGIENVGNAMWQSVRGFPAPGRAWNAACTIYSPSHH